MIISIIYLFIRWWIGSLIFDRIKDLVLKMISSDLTNAEKREYVITKTNEEIALIKSRCIDLIISVVLVQLKGP